MNPLSSGFRAQNCNGDSAGLRRELGRDSVGNAGVAILVQQEQDCCNDCEEQTMPIKRRPDIKPSEVTPESVFRCRREILKAALAAGLFPAAHAWGQAVGGGLHEPMPLTGDSQRERHPPFPADRKTEGPAVVAERRGRRAYCV